MVPRASKRRTSGPWTSRPADFSRGWHHALRERHLQLSQHLSQWRLCLSKVITHRVHQPGQGIYGELSLDAVSAVELHPGYVGQPDGGVRHPVPTRDLRDLLDHPLGLGLLLGGPDGILGPGRSLSSRGGSRSRAGGCSGGLWGRGRGRFPAGGDVRRCLGGAPARDALVHDPGFAPGLLVLFVALIIGHLPAVILVIANLSPSANLVAKKGWT